MREEAGSLYRWVICSYSHEILAGTTVFIVLGRLSQLRRVGEWSRSRPDTEQRPYRGVSPYCTPHWTTDATNIELQKLARSVLTQFVDTVMGLLLLCRRAVNHARKASCTCVWMWLLVEVEHWQRQTILKFILIPWVLRLQQIKKDIQYMHTIQCIKIMKTWGYMC